MITTKVKIKQHLAEYCYGKFSGCDISRPVTFPDKLNIYHVIWDLLEVCPRTGPVCDGNLEIVLPERTIGKNPLTYNYLGERAIPHINKHLDIIFSTELFYFMLDQKNHFNIPYNRSIFAFMRRYGITSVQEDTLWKSFYRWKKRIVLREKRPEMEKNFEDLAR
ncbi:MAG: hypothetical protein LBL58_12430 [Tannerellaceae bacterium]|jgi:hypothetical protein|nr:hypothetical protein [Tannerellaceae bacterium]